MTLIEATARAPIYKTGKLFSKDRYSIFLLVNDTYTTVHAHARTMAGARKAARLMASQAETYIEEAGVMGELFDTLANEALGRVPLPTVGDRVWLTKPVAGLPKGSQLLVVESGWREEDRGCLPENTFPVTGLPLDDDGQPVPNADSFPLSLDEYSNSPVAPEADADPDDEQVDE